MTYSYNIQLNQAETCVCTTEPFYIWNVEQHGIPFPNLIIV